MPNNYVLLDRIELNASAASVTFDNIPQSGYTDLKIVMSTRSSASATVGYLTVAFNGSTANFSTRGLYGYGSGVGSFTTPSNFGGELVANSATASTFSNFEMYIPNYRSSNFKSYSVDSVGENNGTLAQATLNAGLWSQTASITSVAFTPNSGSFLAGSTFSLYGIAQVGTTPAIAPKANGGNVIGTDGTYWYHAFLSNGTFTPQVGLTADVLVVAGGGAGSGGGGGAGGLLGFSSQSLNTTAYTCIVGAGGSRATAYQQVGGSGSNSQFGSLTASIGGGGAGANEANNAASGGSGGGGGAWDASTTTGAAGTAGQGYAGGGNGGYLGGPYPAGGGGGAGGAGSSAPGGSTGGNGGTGVSTYSSWATATSTGASGFYAGGGGGCTYFAGTPGSGGSGGGGAGSSNNATATAGTANTGGGGGGSQRPESTAGLGGSGIIIIRYPVAS